MVKDANIAIAQKNTLEDQVQEYAYEIQTLQNQIIQKDGIIDFLKSNRENTPVSAADTT